MELSKFQINILLIIASLIAGFYLNKLANNQANKQLLAQLEADIATINHVQKTARGEESKVLAKKKQDIEAQIRILSQKK